jgi:localization factor PodJL
MKPGIPWSIKGVEPELREIAKTAARRSGMTLGEWLNSAINDQADEKTSPDAPAAKVSRSRISSHPMERAATKLEDIAEQLASLARRETDTRSFAPQQPSEDAFVIGKVLSRVESNERQTVEAFSAVNDRLATLSRQITQSNRPQVVAKPEDAPGFQTLEKAVRNIVEHLEVSDKRTRENLKSLQDRMTDMASRAGGASNDQVLRQAPAFSQLENRLSELARRVDQSQNQSQMPVDLPDVLRRELENLAGRIDTVRDTAESLAAKAQTQAVQASQVELRVIEDRILGLLREAQTSFVASSGSPADIQRFRGEIDKLNSRIDDASQDVASNRDVTALRSAVEQLSTRVAQGPDLRPLADMDKRILDISKRLEQSQSASRDLPQLNELERRMVELDHRLNDAIRLQGDGAARVELEDKLAEVNERLGRTESQLGHLGTIEKAISQLYDTIEQSRTWTKEVAEDAAHRMGQHVMSQQPAPINLAGSPEIMALEQGLHVVREASQHADARNQETLEAVHETLEQIVSKLAELETAAIGQRVAHAISPPTAPLSSAESLMAFAPENAVAPSIEPKPAVEPEAINVFAEAPEPEVVSSNPFEAVAPVTGNPFDLGLPEVAPAAVAADDFIAAARRAAQAANQPKSLLGNIAPGAGRLNQGKSKKGLSLKLPFMKGSKTAKITNADGDVKIPPEIKPANSNIAGNRRSLVLSGIVLLTALAFFIGKNVLGSGEHATQIETPATIEQPMEQPKAEVPATEAAPVAAEAAPAVATPQVAPLEAAPVPEQHSEAAPVAGTDEILTGSLPAAIAPLSMPKDVATMVDAIGPKALRLAATTGDASAQFVVATRYLNGENVISDPVKAAYWYGKAAAAGLAPAQYRLATLYERGKGIDKDMKAALSWYERAAGQGNVRAMHNAAVISAGNESGAPDYARAYKWFSMAANHGLKDSEFNLAVLIERGLGTKPDAVEALFWYYAAAAQDDQDAGTHADQLAKSLAPDAVAKVKSRLLNWKPAKAEDAANVVAVNDNDWKVGVEPIQTAAAGSDNLVGTTQSLLDKLGFKIGTADGKMGGRTANAIRLFQLQEGLKVTGEVTPELIDALKSKTS